jgi:hypothetical protein
MAVSESDLKDSREQLALILSFFPRVDAKLSTILAIDTGMLAALSASFPPIDNFRWWLAIAPGVTILLLAFSYRCLYRGGFPDVRGGHDSFVYFAAIAKRTEVRFIDGYIAQNHENLRCDVLGQVWRNSEILVDKYKSLKTSFLLMASAVPPWALSLALLAAHKANVHVTVNHP